VKKKWLNDLRIGCKPPSNLVELIEKDFDFEEELKNLNIHLNEMELWTFKMLKDFFFI